MDEEIKNNKDLYQCKECGLHYKDKKSAEKCEVWCRENKTCNVEITKHSKENKKDGLSDELNKLEELEKQCEEYLNSWKRERADFLNYKKEEMERIGTLIKYANEELILKIMPILDNFSLAEKQIPENLKNDKWIEGFLQIKSQIGEFLKREGVEEINAVGERFNPETMEAVEEVEPVLVEALTGTVVQELQKGYRMDGKVLRPAKVKVTK